MKYQRKVSYLSYSSSTSNSVPYVRLSGKWLGKLGFRIGSSFTISFDESEEHSQPNRIILTPIDLSANDQTF